MFIRLSTILPVAALAAVVSAAPGVLDVRAGSTTTTECTTGANSCCSSIQSSSSTVVSELAALFGVSLTGTTSQVGLGCTSVSSTTECVQQPACCTGNTFSGAIVVGCSPINIA